MLIQSSVSPASGWNLYETKNEKEREREKEKEREKERETTNSIIPSKQSKKNAGIHLYCWNIRHHSYLLKDVKHVKDVKDVKHVKHLNMAQYDVKSNSGWPSFL